MNKPNLSLRELQSLFLHHLQQGSGDDIPSLRHAHRFFAYGNGYWIRFEDIIESVFHLTKIVFSQNIVDLTRQALTRHPSTHYSVDQIGLNFLAYLENDLDWKKEKKQMILDLARFDWMMNEMYQEPFSSPIDLQQMTTIPPSDWDRAILRLQPCCKIVPFSWNLFDFHRKETYDLEKIKEASLDLLIYKDRSQGVFFESLEPNEKVILQALKNGESLGSALSNTTQATQEEIQGWFSKWFDYGLFVGIDFHREV
ncbi:MAG: putative DNA-binding domain-containing protein [Bdellovibrionota bacterium]